MNGENEMRLCEAAMIEAVQQYLDGQFAPGKAPQVTSVSWLGSVERFEINMTDTNPK